MIELVLTIDAMLAILDGNAICFKLPAGVTSASLSCDEAAQLAFRDHKNRAQLEMMPAPPLIN